jgi:hypothetical protein
MSIEAERLRQLVRAHLDQPGQAPAQAAEAAPVYGGYHHAAAVLSSFDDKRLQPDGAGDTLAEVLEVSKLSAGDSDGFVWVLLPEVRRAVLRAMQSRGAMQRALAANSARPQHPTQQMLEAYIAGTAPPLEQQNVAQLTATLQVLEWLAGILPGLPTAEEALARRGYRELLQPFEDLIGQHFFGRAPELAQLREYVGVLDPASGAALPPFSSAGAARAQLQERPPLVIHGVGGVGKSSLLAHFILEYAALREYERFPWVFVDFDRPEFDADEPLTLLVEALRQLAAQYPQAREFCESLRREWLSRLDRLRTRTYNSRALTKAATQYQSASRESVASTVQDWLSWANDFASLLGYLRLEGAPLLFVIDTFEEAQYHGPDSVARLCTFVKVLMEAVPLLRFVILGRAPIRELPEFSAQELELANFGPADAQAFLEQKGVQPPEAARRLAAAVAGNPLTLTLAAQAWQREGDALLAWSAINKELTEGQLVTRVLGHIHDERVRALAYPGLALRRITPAIIRDVLAGPCGIVVESEADAEELFDMLRREVGLVVLEGNALRHRPGVRRIMRELLRHEEQARVEAIERAAVAYYEAHGEDLGFTEQERLINRAEEIYHRLSLCQALDEVEARWRPGVEDYLVDAPDELGLQERIWLKQKLGQSISADERQQAGHELWEREAERRAQDLAGRNQLAEALAALRERSQRMPGSALFLLEARICERLGRDDEAMRLAEEGIGNADSKRRDVIDLSLLAARVAMRRSEIERARQLLDGAQQLLSEGSSSDERALALTLHRLALSVQAGQMQPQQLADLRQNAAQLFAKLRDAQVRDQPELMGWLAEAVGDGYPAVLLRLVTLLGLRTERQAALRALGRALAAWQAALERAAGAPPPAPLTLPPAGDGPAWEVFVLRSVEEARRGTSPQPFASVLAWLLGERGDLPVELRIPPPPVRRALIAILREPAVGARYLQAPAGLVNGAPNYAMQPQPRLPDELVAPLAGALAAATPSRAALAEMVRLRLEQNVDAAAQTHDLAATAEALARSAVAQGWALSLLAAARDAYPGDTGLRALAERLGLAPATPGDDELAELLREANSPLTPAEWRAELGRMEARVCQVDTPAGRFSGFLIGADLVLTSVAAHGEVALVFDRKSLRDGAVLHPGLVYAAQSGSGAAEVLWQSAGSGLAVLRLSDAPGSSPIGSDRAEFDALRRGWVDLGASVQDSLGPLVMLHFPDSSRGPLAVDIAGRAGPTGQGTVAYQHHTRPGSAGAPVFDMHWRLVAIDLGRTAGGGAGLAASEAAAWQSRIQAGIAK